MLVLLVVSLFTSRIVVDELGIDDYGIYVVIGGVVSLLGFLNSCTTSTQRFLNFELGRENSSVKRLESIFSNALAIHLIIAMIMYVLAETIGLWFINTKLVIPQDRLYEANILYQTSLMVFCISVFQMPFSAAIIAHEKMSIYAILGIVDIFLKLIAALLLYLISNYKLIYYGIFLLSVQTLVCALYIIVCKIKFKECGLKIRYTHSIFIQLFSFTGWNMLGSIAWLARNQGIGIILNLFWGVVLNAAKGISDQVTNAVNTLSNNFQLALNPQITKSYAAGEYDQMELLAFRGIKFSCVLLWLMGLPLMLNIDYILFLWLEKIPEYSALFINLSIVDILVSNLFGSPLMASLSATGKIRTYQISVGLVLLCALPVSYIALKFGFPPEVVFIINIIFSVIGGILRLMFCKIQIKFSIRRYLNYVFIPVILVVLISSILPLIVQNIITPKTFGLFLISVLVCVTSVIISVWYVALNNSERTNLKNLIKNGRFQKG